MISPINLKKISEMVISNDYTKYFVVLDKDDLGQENQVFQDIIAVDMPSKKIISPARQNFVRKRKNSGKKKIDIYQKSFSFTHRYNAEKFAIEKINSIKQSFALKINNRLILSAIILSLIHI